jgi:hypothetical protein
LIAYPHVRKEEGGDAKPSGGFWRVNPRGKRYCLIKKIHKLMGSSLEGEAIFTSFLG